MLSTLLYKMPVSKNDADVHANSNKRDCLWGKRCDKVLLCVRLFHIIRKNIIAENPVKHSLVILAVPPSQQVPLNNEKVFKRFVTVAKRSESAFPIRHIMPVDRHFTD